MKLFAMIFLFGFQFIAGELEKTCYIPATCSSPTSKYSTTEWMKVDSPSESCKADVGAKGEIGPVGSKGEVGPVGTKGEMGPAGPKGEMGPVGEKGVNGSKGEVGPGGRKGETGTIGQKGENGTKGDTGSVDDSIIRTIHNDTNALQQKIENLEKIVGDIDECRLGTGVLLDRIKALEQKVNSTALQTKCENTTNQCVGYGVLYDEKCYFAVIHRAHDVAYSQRASICNGAGGTIAGIWNRQHQNLIENYVRAKLRHSDLIDGSHIWTSMTYHYSSSTLTMPNGFSFPKTAFDWYPNTPYGDSSYSAVWFPVYKDQSSVYQGLYNYVPSYASYGVLCVK